MSEKKVFDKEFLKKMNSSNKPVRIKWMIFVILFAVVNIIIIFGNIESSLAYITLGNLSASEETNITLYLTTEDGDEYTETVMVTDGSASFFIRMEYHDVQSIVFELDADEVDISNATVSVISRSKVVYAADAELEENDGYVFSEKQLSKIRGNLNSDRYVKLQMLIIAWLIFFLAALLMYFKIKGKADVKIILSTVATIVLVFVIYAADQIYDTYTTYDPNITNQTVTGVITQETEIVQQIEADSSLLGVVIRFATYGTEIDSDYTLVLYDADGSELEEITIEATDISDNSYSEIWFNNAYDAGTYYFSVKTYTETDDRLVIWMSNDDYYEEGSLTIDDVEMSGDLDFQLLVEGPNVTVWIIAIALGIYILVLMMIWRVRYRIYFIYGAALVFAAAMMIFACENLYIGTYDEMAHISYIANIVNKWEFLPTFEEQYFAVSYDKVLSTTTVNTYSVKQAFGTLELKFGDTVNYLCHPPLYYWIMAATNAVKIDGDLITVNLIVLRVANMFLTMASLALFFYVGLTRLDRRYPELHFFYAAVIVSLPMITGLGAAITNDNLCFLIAAIFFVAMIRFTEGNRDQLTYLLIALSIAMAGLTKVTLLIIIVITGLMVAFGTVYREKSWACLINVKFLVVMPIILIAVLYYILQYSRYGSLMISLSKIVSEETFEKYTFVYKDESNRSDKSYIEFLLYFIQQFLIQWSGGINWNVGDEVKTFVTYFIHRGLWFVPLASIVFAKLKDAREWFYKSFSIALMTAVILQFSRAVNDLFYNSGHPGLQSRYYICVAPIMVFIVCDMFEHIMARRFRITAPSEKNVVRLNGILKCLLVLLGISAIYGGILVYMFNCTNYSY